MSKFSNKVERTIMKNEKYRMSYILGVKPPIFSFNRFFDKIPNEVSSSFFSFIFLN